MAFLALRREVAVAIDFDHKESARAIKIRDVLAEWLLSRESLGKISEELVPELVFRWRRIAPEGPRRMLEATAVIDERRVGHPGLTHGRTTRAPPARLRLTTPLSGGQRREQFS